MAKKEFEFNPKKYYSKEVLSAVENIRAMFNADTSKQYWFSDPVTIGIPDTSIYVPADSIESFTRVFSKFQPLNINDFMMLCSYITFVKSKQLVMQPHENRFHWHAGFNSDLRELETAVINFNNTGATNDRVNMVEELGDVLFFVLSYAFEYDLHFAVVADILRLLDQPADYDYTSLYDVLMDNINVGYREIADLADIEKGRMTSNKPFNILDVRHKLRALIRIVVSGIRHIATSPETTSQTILVVIDANKEKLGFRYGSGSFTPDEDLARDTDEEYKIMDEKIG